MKQVETLHRMRTSALVGEMLRVLEEAGITPPTEVEKRMYDVAREFDSTSLGLVLRESRTIHRMDGAAPASPR